MTEIDGKEITYDESGNMLKMGEKVYTWTNFRCLDTYTDMNTEVKYTYNCDGIRTSKTIDGSKTEYTLLGAKITSQTTDGKTMYFYYDSNDEIFALNYNNKDYFYVKNLQGDILKILDASGETVVEYTYDAWGNCAFNPDSTTNRTLAVNNPFRYRSYYYDKDSKLYFLQSRYYDPSIGRFISSDDIAYLGATGTVLSYNMFAYCENNAVNCSDPTGEWGANVHSGYKDGDNYEYFIFPKKEIVKIGKRYVTLYRSEKKYYGTYYWARNLDDNNNYGYSPTMARIIAAWCAGVDTIFSPWKNTNSQKQSWHFNTNKEGLDSRLINSAICLFMADYYLQIAQQKYNKYPNFDIKYRRDLTFALMYIGMGLHPMQDIFSHTSKVSYDITIKNKTLYSHLGFIFVDNAFVKWNVVNGVVKTETRNILKAFYNEYSVLRCGKLAFSKKEINAFTDVEIYFKEMF